jgi:hypothetical protein
MKQIRLNLVFYCVLERLNVRCLPALRPLNDIELNGLTFLKALEAIRDNGRVMHEDILPILPRNEAESLRVVKPLYGTLFHVMLFPIWDCAGANGANFWQNLAAGRGTALARFSSNAFTVYQIHRKQH